MHVFTLTGNLLAETTYTFDSWAEGATQRAREESFQVGGKGINVTRMLRRLGIESTALCFPGGATGSRCEAWLAEHRIPFRAFRTPAETRTGAAVRAPGRRETTFLGAENRVDAAAIEACAAFLDRQPATDLLSIGGSIPDWDAEKWDPLRDAVRRWCDRRSRLVVDTYGSPLAWFGGLPADLVKINRREFSQLAGVPLAEATEAAMPDLLARTSVARQATRWVITDGPNAIWFCERGTAPCSILPPRVEEVSPTGSGDVFLAGLIAGLEQPGHDLAAAIAFALPLAAANAASPGVAEFDLGPLGLGGS